MSAYGRRNEAPRHTWEKTSGSQGKAFWSFFYIWFGFLCAQVSCAMGIARQGSLDKFAILTLKPRSHVRILIYIERGLFKSKFFTSQTTLNWVTVAQSANPST